MPNYSKRLLDEKIEKKLKSTGGILLKGVRFCGKTTVLSQNTLTFFRVNNCHIFSFVSIETMRFFRHERLE